MDLGNISYSVDIETEKVVTGTSSATKQLDRLETSTKRVDTSSKAANSSLSKLEGGLGRVENSSKKAADATGGFASKLTPLAGIIAGAITVQTVAQWGALAEQFTLLQARINRLTPDLSTATSTYQRLLTVAAATGQTMPETVKLWETLTSSLKSLGATNEEVITLTSTLQKIGKIGGSSAEETSNALRQLGQSLASGTLRAEEYNSIVEQTPELVRQLAAASGRSMGEFRQAMLDGKLSSQELFDLLLSRTGAVDTEFKKLPRSASDAANAISVQFGAALAVIDKATKASQYLSKALDGIAKGIQLAFNPSDQDRFNQLLGDRQKLLDSIAQAEGTWRQYMPGQTKAREDLANIEKELGELRDKNIARLKAESAAQETKAQAPKPTTTPDGQKAIEQLREQNELMRVQGEERVKVAALQKLGSTATQQERDQAVQLAVDTYRLQEAEKARSKAKTEGVAAAKKAESEAAAEIKRENEEARKGYEQNQKAIQDMAAALAYASLKGEDLAVAQAKAKLNKFASPEDVAEVERLTKALLEQQRVAANKELVKQVDPVVGAGSDNDKRLADIKTLEDAEILSKQRADELRLASETSYQEQVRAMQEETFRQAALGNEILFGSIDALSQGAAQSLSGLLSGTTSLQDALGGIAETVLNTVIGSFTQMGAEWVKQEIMKQAAVQATTATQTAGIATVAATQAGATGAIAATTTATAATTGAAVAGSMAPAAGLSSIASFGGAAVIGGSALLATMLLAKSFGGGRQYGGGVDAGSMYRVNETGAPEIFNAANGRQYMMPNTRGEVVSNKDATAGNGPGSGVAPVVNVNNYTGQAAQAEARFSEADRRWVIDVVVGDAATGGSIGRTVNQITGTKRAGS